MIYDVDPQQILFQNRTRIPNLEQLTDQVNALARNLIQQELINDRIIQLETIIALFTTRVGTPVARILNSDFVISLNQDTIGFYTIELTTSLSLTGTDEVSVDLNLDGISMAQVKNKQVLNLGILSLTDTSTQRYLLSGYVRRSQIVNLAVTSNSGTATYVSGFEVLL